MSKILYIESILNSLPYKSTVLSIESNITFRPDLIITNIKSNTKFKDNTFDAIIINKARYMTIIHEIDRILNENGICIVMPDNGFNWIAWKWKHKLLRYRIIDTIVDTVIDTSVDIEDNIFSKL